MGLPVFMFADFSCKGVFGVFGVFGGFGGSARASGNS